MQDVSVRTDYKDSVLLICHGSLRRLQARRSEPVVDVGSGVGLASFPQEGFPDGSGWQQLCLLATARGFLDESILEGFGLFETASLQLHGAAPC